MERLGRAPISLPHVLVSMTGGFQPDKLARSFGRDDDGMYARHIFGWPTEPEYQPLSEGEGTEIEPRYLPLTEDARAVFEAFRRDIHTSKAALDGREREWWAKGPGHVLRLAGTLAYMAWAMPGATPHTKSGLERLMAAARLAEEPTAIEARIVKSAVRLWRSTAGRMPGLPSGRWASRSGTGRRAGCYAGCGRIARRRCPERTCGSTLWVAAWTLTPPRSCSTTS